MQRCKSILRLLISESLALASARSSFTWHSRRPLSWPSASPRDLVELRVCFARVERLEVLALETIFLVVELLSWSLREVRSLVMVEGMSLGPGIPDFLVACAPDRLRGRASARSEMAPVVTVFFIREPEAASAGFVKASSLLALLSLLRRCSEASMLEDLEVFMAEEEEVVVVEEDGVKEACF